MNTNLVQSNGINATTGSYLLPPLEPHLLAKVAQGERLSRKDFHYQDLKRKQTDKHLQHLGPAEHINPINLAESGWGVIFPAQTDLAIKDALSLLLRHRQMQAASNNERYYREFIGADGYQPGDTKQQFLERHGVGPGPVDPDNGVPYYLLIVGGPESIPFWFQYQLDVQFAVGRISFDTLQDYANYAHSVVTAETSTTRLAPQAAFIGVRNMDDRATTMSADHLITPLAQEMTNTYTNWSIRQFVGENQATKDTISRVIGGDETPALIFTASHGLGFPKGHRLQNRHQGALICQDWPGPIEWRGEMPERFYLSADDIGDNAHLHGSIAFLFACFGAGTPRIDAFSHHTSQPRDIAPAPFLAHLPKRMLAHPKGGTLAVIGHIERAWGYSFDWGDAGTQREVFVSTLTRLIEGHPVGSALEFFNERYAEIATDLTAAIEAKMYSKQVSDQELARMWTANNDARNYAIIGDPAVRLHIDPNGIAPGKRPAISQPPTVHGAIGTHPQATETPADDTIETPPASTIARGGDTSAAPTSYSPAPHADSAEIASTLPSPPDETPAARDAEPEQAKPHTPTAPEEHETDDREQTRLHYLMKRWYRARLEEHRARVRTEKCLQELEEELRHIRINLSNERKHDQ